MDIAFCLNDDYVPYVMVTMRSILINNPQEVCFHLLIDKITQEHQRRLTRLVEKFDAKLIFYIINDSSLQNLNCRCFTKYAWYRILLPNVLPDTIKKVLYLDTDIIVAGNLKPLFDINMEGKSIAAALDYPSFMQYVYYHCDRPMDGKYICSGVLYMNLEYWRNNNITNKIIKWAEENGDLLKCPDQDAINHICYGSKVILPLYYGVQSLMLTQPEYFISHKDEIKKSIETPVIIHYSSCSPWYYECKHPLVDYWDKYNREFVIRRNSLKFKSKMSLWLRMKTKCWRIVHNKGKRYLSEKETMLRNFKMYLVQ